jgi:hypothetical protein
MQPGKRKEIREQGMWTGTKKYREEDVESVQKKKRRPRHKEHKIKGTTEWRKYYNKRTKKINNKIQYKREIEAV